MVSFQLALSWQVRPPPNSQWRSGVDDESLVLDSALFYPLNHLSVVPAGMKMPPAVCSRVCVSSQHFAFQRHIRGTENALSQVIKAVVCVNLKVALFDLVLLSGWSIPDDAIEIVHDEIQAVQLVGPRYLPQRITPGINPRLAKMLVLVVV